jgi:hypothetical protein
MRGDGGLRDAWCRRGGAGADGGGRRCGYGGSGGDMRTGVGSNAQGGGRDAGKGTRVRAAGASERKAGARGGCTGELKKYERVFFLHFVLFRSRDYVNLLEMI